MSLDEGPRCSLSGVIIRLGGFHLLLLSMGSIGTVVAGKGADASSMCTSISHLNETMCEEQCCSHGGWGAYAKGIRVILLSERYCLHYYRSRPL